MVALRPDGQADVLMSVGEGGTRLWRGDRELTGALPTLSLGGESAQANLCNTESWGSAERGMPRYAQLTAAQTARNLDLSSPEAVAAL